VKSKTPETDAVWKGNDTAKQVMTSRRLERERDEAREENAKLLTYWKERERIALNAASEHSESVSKLHRRAQRVEAQNTKLRDIAERAIEMLEFNAHSKHGTIVQLRYELDQLKQEGAK